VILPDFGSCKPKLLKVTAQKTGEKTICVLKRNKDGNIEDETFRSVEVSKTCSRMERKEI